MKTLFDFKGYQAYLLHYFQLKRGNQAHLAEHLDCRSSFLTQVIDEKVDLSLEQTLKVSDYLGFNKNEKLAFLHMVQREKVYDLKEKHFFDEQIESLKSKNSRVKERINLAEELSEEAKYQYYSSWIYGATHILCAFSWIKTVDDIVKEIGVDRPSVNEAVQFLLQHQLIALKNNQLTIGKQQIHLADDSKNIFSHHMNWRLRAIEKMSSQKKQALNFSSLIGISKKDVEPIRDILVNAISEINKVVVKSGEEKAYIINMDLLDL